MCSRHQARHPRPPRASHPPILTTELNERLDPVPISLPSGTRTVDLEVKAHTPHEGTSCGGATLALRRGDATNRGNVSFSTHRGRFSRRRPMSALTSVQDTSRVRVPVPPGTGPVLLKLENVEGSVGSTVTASVRVVPVWAHVIDVLVLVLAALVAIATGWSGKSHAVSAVTGFAGVFAVYLSHRLVPGDTLGQVVGAIFFAGVLGAGSGYALAVLSRSVLGGWAMD